MAENHYFIFVSNQPSPDFTQLLPKLGLVGYEPDTEVDLTDTNKPDTLYAGYYNNCLIFAHPDLPFHFFNKIPSETEKRFIACFPEAEIAALLENTTVNMFGYSIFQNGRKIRMKDGSDNKYYNDFGELVQEEKEARLEEYVSEEEIEEMREYEMDEEEIAQYIRFQSDWGVPNLITKRYLGEYFGAIGRGKVKITKYKLRTNK
jgi:hypothetical protein